VTPPGDIPVSCPGCGAEFQVPARYAGRAGKCPLCATSVTVPAPRETVVDARPEPQNPYAVKGDPTPYDPDDDDVVVDAEPVAEPDAEPRSRLPSDAYAPCFVCVHDESKVPHMKIAPVIQQVCGLARQDAFSSIRHGHGVLVETSAENARELERRLHAMGLPVFSVAAALLPRVRGGRPIRRCRFQPDALAVEVDIHGNTQAVRWPAILVVAGSVMGGTRDVYRSAQHHYYGAGTGVYGGSLRVHMPGRHERQERRDAELHVLALAPPGVRQYVFDQKRLSYECLGALRAQSGTVNFQRFAQSIIERAPRAVVPHTTREFLQTNVLHLPVVRNRAEIRRYHTWLLCRWIATNGPIPHTSY
jgi:hypothetical protein